MRKQMGGHDEYNYFRSAIELLEVEQVDGSAGESKSEEVSDYFL